MAEDSAASPGGEYAAETESLRSAAKWLLAAAAGVAGLLVAGLQLSSLGRLTSGEVGHLALALVGLVLTLAGVAFVIYRAAALLSDTWITLWQLSSSDEFSEERLDRIKSSGSAFERRRNAREYLIFDQIRDSREELYGNVATDLAGLYRELKTTNREWRSSAPGPERAELAAHSAEVRTTAKEVVDFANYLRTRSDFDALRRALAVAGIAAVTGLVLFAIGSNPPVRQNGNGSDQHPACCTISTPPCCCTSTPTSPSAYMPTPDPGPSPTPDPGPSPTPHPAPSR
jgi:hypothetical protein